MDYILPQMEEGNSKATPATVAAILCMENMLLICRAKRGEEKAKRSLEKGAE